MATTQQDRVLDTLGDLVPEDSREKVAAAVTSLLDEAVNDLTEQFKSEYNTKLDEGYKVIAEEREKDWQTALQGYRQAYEIISELRTRLTRQEDEFEQTLEEEYEKAYQMILAERSKNENLSESMYEEYEGRTEKIKEFIVDSADKFLAEMGEEYYDMAMREVLSDPCLAEHRVAFERVLDVTKDYLSDEDIMLGTNERVSELEQRLESVEVAKRQIESKNMRLMTENNKMHEYLKETKELIEKNIINEQNERRTNARKVEGLGKVSNETQREVVLGEAVDSARTVDRETADDNSPKTITEQWQVLAGINSK